MKKIFSYVVATVLVAMFTACGGTKTVQVTNANQPQSPFSGVFSVPNGEFDTDEYYAASGIATGPKARMGELYSVALKNAQNIVRQKIKHSYKGAIDDYMNVVGNNVGDDFQSKMERGGTQIIDAIVNDTRETNPPLFSPVDEKGNVTCYLGIRVYKEIITDKIADYLSDDEEMKINYKEEQFRENMEENHKKHKENK